MCTSLKGYCNINQIYLKGIIRFCVLIVLNNGISLAMITHKSRNYSKNNLLISGIDCIILCYYNNMEAFS